MLPHISKTIQIRQTRHCCRSKNELISDVLQWVSTHRHTSVSRQARTYLYQLGTNTRFSL